MRWFIVDAIYDCVLALKTDNGVKPSISMITHGQPVNAQILIKRIPIKDVPIDDENQCSKYLFDLYEKKVIHLFTTLKFYWIHCLHFSI